MSYQLVKLFIFFIGLINYKSWFPFSFFSVILKSSPFFFCASMTFENRLIIDAIEIKKKENKERRRVSERKGE